jgi:farnesyl diphosphate synthase
MDVHFAEQLKEVAGEADRLLATLLADAALPGERRRPARLMAAMRHGALAGGKRMRPFLTLAAAGLVHPLTPGAERERVLRVAAAVELVHCYSLIHDDLPAMDNDDLRRGQPTVHRAFDEATAILAGDGLLTLAFAVLADGRTHRSGTVRSALVAELALGSGIGGMVGGQMLDLAAEGRFPGEAPANDEAAIITIQAMKTGALIRSACRLGAIIGGANMMMRDALDTYAEALGLAFQIKDDLLDAEGDAATIGKSAGKDAAAGKATFVGLLGIAGARQRLAAVSARGLDAMVDFGPAADPLRRLMAFNATRET